MHLKCLEIERFKSFGPRTVIPLLVGFTVVSGPNGSGKSNIIDALLFALGLSTSRGMRAEKLSDLIHQGVSHGEATVTATFALDDDGGELVVSRRLRVNGTNSTSTFTLDGTVCTLGELHDRLAAHRIYPEGYNVVLQGDVTGIITMPARERREIIDELAGVAEFDRKIDAARRELGEVETRSERIGVVLAELKEQLERLRGERARAEEYRTIRTELVRLAAWEQQLLVRELAAQIHGLRFEIEVGEGSLAALAERSVSLARALEEAEDALDTANTRVRAMGENEQVALRAQIASQQARRAQTERALAELEAARRQAATRRAQTEAELDSLALQLSSYSERQEECRGRIGQWQERLGRERAGLEAARHRLEELSTSSQRWLAEQAALRRRVTELREAHDPLTRRHERLGDRLQQAQAQIARLEAEAVAQADALARVAHDLAAALPVAVAERAEADALAARLEAERQTALTDRSTLRRLEKERAEKLRELDRYEAQKLAWREAEGSRATQEVLAARLPGVHGLVSQLARVEPAYQLALEVAAGGRLNNIVVDDDHVAAQAIALLKSRRAGRATFLPLSKLRTARPLDRLSAPGAVGYAIDLIDFDSRYAAAFAQVFGDTVVFRDLDAARNQMGAYRMVTLTGELLEKSGAMTGGSFDGRRGGGFAVSEPPEVTEGRRRLADLDGMIAALAERLEGRERTASQMQSALDATNRRSLAAENRAEQLRREEAQLAERHATGTARLAAEREAIVRLEAERTALVAEIAPLAAELARLEPELAELEADRSHQDWQQAQQQVREQETEVRRSEAQLRNLEADQQKLALDEQLCHQKRQDLLARLLEWETENLAHDDRAAGYRAEIAEIDAALAALDVQMAEIEARLGACRRERDAFDKQVRTLGTQKRQCDLDREGERLRQEQRTAALAALEARLAEAGVPADDGEAPPADLSLEQIQQQRARRQRRLEALEPVNMLAIEEFERTGARLEELSDKIATLDRERSELLLRVEDFATLKREAFMQAFTAVDAHFQAIFAELSDGDGHLALEEPNDPFAGGLTLVAHPRGKKVRRLESMSGGEKSLTALSFIFALQRYRPSPFYAFDEVDMFLDGANVERLARMIRQQADLAQFLVVSLRRPMIERSDRAIGVTLARAGHSQVLGVELTESRATAASQAS